MKIMNRNMAGQKFRYRDGKGDMVEAVCDADGVVDLPEKTAEALKNTVGWSAPAQRAPRKPPTKPTAPSDPTGDEDSDDDGEGSDDVPPYSEWDYADLKAEAKKRLENDPNFQPPDSNKGEDIISALETDDAKG